MLFPQLDTTIQCIMNNTNQILLFLKSAKNISCYRENEHLLNLEVLDEIERTGFPLLLAIFCENIITETANES